MPLTQAERERMTKCNTILYFWSGEPFGVCLHPAAIEHVHSGIQIWEMHPHWRVLKSEDEIISRDGNHYLKIGGD